jgi:hypothetical protein
MKFDKSTFESDAKILGININDYDDGIDFAKACDNMSNIGDRPQWPNKINFTTYHIYQRGEVLHKSVSSKERVDIVKNNPGCVCEEVFDKEGFDAAWVEYRMFEARVSNVFKFGILKIHGMLDHPKAEKAFNVAAELGNHRIEIAEHLDDLFDLMS